MLRFTPEMLDLDPAAGPVVAAMSGGVDSSVAAALLHEAGFKVIGVTLQLYDQGAVLKKKGACCAGQDVYDAARVAEKMGFAHYVLDHESRFGQAVVDDFADSYLAGATPVPCVRCNQTVKFQDLMQVARDLGAQAMVTGHYVQRLLGAEGPELHMAADPAKDQSWFLFATTKDQLSYLRFPLGHVEKAETRAAAERLGLPVAAKPDSQDICFVPDGDYAGVVESLRPGAGRPGQIRHLDGRVLGQHRGIIRYTIGQRRGLGLGGHDGDASAPLYVVGLEPDSATVLVGPRAALARDVVQLSEVNALAPLAEGRAVRARLRSSMAPAPATLHQGGALVRLDQPVHGVSPGQACAFYDGTRLLGGGWIRAAELSRQVA